MTRRHIIESVKREYPNKTIIYRPHPYLNDQKAKCKLVEPKRVEVRTHEEMSLREELELASVVVTLSSTASIEVRKSQHPVAASQPLVTYNMLTCCLAGHCLWRPRDLPRPSFAHLGSQLPQFLKTERCRGRRRLSPRPRPVGQRLVLLHVDDQRNRGRGRLQLALRIQRLEKDPTQLHGTLIIPRSLPFSSSGGRVTRSMTSGERRGQECKSELNTPSSLSSLSRTYPAMRVPCHQLCRSTDRLFIIFIYMYIYQRILWQNPNQVGVTGMQIILSHSRCEANPNAVCGERSRASCVVLVLSLLLLFLFLLSLLERTIATACRALTLGLEPREPPLVARFLIHTQVALSVNLRTISTATMLGFLSKKQERDLPNNQD